MQHPKGRLRSFAHQDHRHAVGNEERHAENASGFSCLSSSWIAHQMNPISFIFHTVGPSPRLPSSTSAWPFLPFHRNRGTVRSTTHPSAPECRSQRPGRNRRSPRQNLQVSAEGGKDSRRTAEAFTAVSEEADVVVGGGWGGHDLEIESQLTRGLRDTEGSGMIIKCH